MKLFDFIKLGFGFYIGYELAHSMDKILGITCNQVKDRIKNGY